MKPSFQKFLNFLNKTNLSSQLIDKIHILLFCSEKNQKIDIIGLKNKLNISTELATNIFVNLVDSKVIKLKSIYCLDCGEKITVITEQCNSCGYNLELDNFYSNINSFISKKSLDLLKNKYFEDENIKRISREWNKKGYLSYLLLDLVNSEKIQLEMRDQAFTKFFEKVRNTIKYNSFINLEGKYIFLGEQGDCFKIAFTEKEDIFKFITNFSEQINESLQEDPFIKKYKSEITYFPKFRGLVDILNLPKTKDGKISAESIISITLDGTVDFNSKNLTDIFRLDHGISTNNDNCFKKSNLALWISNEFIIKNNLNLNTTKLDKIGKHKFVSRKIGLVLFNGNKLLEIKDPKSYLEE